MPLSGLKSAKRNPKKHADAEVSASIGRFGYVEPMVLDERTGTLVAGHGRRDALSAMRGRGDAPPAGVEERGVEWFVPVLRGWESRSDMEAEAYLLASNQLTTLGGWDNGPLTEMLKELSAAGALEGVGFGENEITKLAEAAASVTQLPPGPVPGEDDVPAEPKKVWVKQGDMFALGPHRILVGDCRSFEDVKRLLDGVSVAVAVTSPPYAAQRAYDESSGFKPILPAEYVQWYRDVSANVLAFLADDGSYFINIKEHCEDGQRSLYVKDLTLAHVREWGWRFVDELIWRRPGIPGENGNVRFRNDFEPIFHFARRVGKNSLKFNPLDVGKESDSVRVYAPTNKNKNTQGNVDVQGEMTTGIARPGNVLDIAVNHENIGHSAMYPVGLPEFFIKAFSDAGDAVFDPFMGSGTTLIAAEKTGRRAFGTEISPMYAQVILERWEKFTNQKAERLP